MFLNNRLSLHPFLIQGGCEYVHWNVYRKYFHKYEIELEYLDFWEELSKNLKVCNIEYVEQSSIIAQCFHFFWSNNFLLNNQWLESYIDIEWSSLKVSVTIQKL